MFSYCAYGLGIASELALPELRPSQGSVDIQIRMAPAEQAPQEAVRNRPFLRITRDEALLSLAVAGTFLIRGGTEILVFPEAGVDERLVRRYLCGTAMGILLHQRGLLVLHASVLAIDGYASAFVGEQGSGKSSIAMALHSLGHGFLCDDVAPVRSKQHSTVIYPAFPQVKVSLETAAAAGLPRQALIELDRFEDKRGYRLESNIVIEPRPLREIFVISEAGELSVERLKPQEAVRELVRHTFPTRLAQPGDGTHLLNCIYLARQVPLYRLPRARTLAELSEFARQLEHTVRSLRTPAQGPGISLPTAHSCAL